jgi:hypothetical protein
MRTLADGTPDEKLALKKMCYQEMYGWDIFPVKLVLPYLLDFDDRVCCQAIRILSCLAGYGKLGREEMRALWSMIGHPDSSVRETFLEMFRRTRFDLDRAVLEDLLLLVRHHNFDVRDSVVRLFLEVPYCFNEKICLRIVNAVSRENLDIQATVYELLEGLGQEHLMMNWQSN